MSLRLPEARADRHGSVFMQTVQNSREELTGSKTSFLIKYGVHIASLINQVRKTEESRSDDAGEAGI